MLEIFASLDLLTFNDIHVVVFFAIFNLCFKNNMNKQDYNLHTKSFSVSLVNFIFNCITTNQNPSLTWVPLLK